MDCYDRPKVKCRLVQLKRSDRDRGVATVEQKIKAAVDKAIRQYDIFEPLGECWFVTVWVDRNRGTHKSFLGNFKQARYTASQNEIYVPMSPEDRMSYQCLL
jgi:hypothetical protein